MEITLITIREVNRNSKKLGFNVSERDVDKYRLYKQKNEIRARMRIGNPPPRIPPTEGFFAIFNRKRLNKTKISINVIANNKRSSLILSAKIDVNPKSEILVPP